MKKPQSQDISSSLLLGHGTRMRYGLHRRGKQSGDILKRTSSEKAMGRDVGVAIESLCVRVCVGALLEIRNLGWGVVWGDNQWPA